MLVQQYKDMLGAKSVIREMAEYGARRARDIGYENVFDYSLGNPSVPTPKKFNDELIRLVQEEGMSGLHGYSPSLGIESVKDAIAKSLNRRFGMNYTAANIFPTSGCAAALSHAFHLVTQPGDTILTFAPFFPEYHPYVDLTGARLKVVAPDLKHFQIDFEKMEEAITPDVMALLINSPNNPSGTVYTTETIKTMAEILKRKEQEYGHDIYIISDEPYREIVFDGVDAPYIAKLYDKTITCYSFSKSVSLPGERIGYVAIAPRCPEAETMIQMCGQISRGIGHNCPTSLIQRAIVSVLDETSDLSVYETNMNILYNELTALGFEIVKPGGTFYMFPKALEKDARRFSEKAMKYDLLLVPGDTFECPGYFRMAYCIATEKVERSLEAFRKFVKEEY